MAINKLQNNYTTPEQSKRLLELGVPADSADCYHNEIARKPFLITYGTLFSDPRHQFSKGTLPCWSAGRLIEIFELCTGIKYLRQMDRPIVEDVKCRIEAYIYHRKFDFSKLEE